MNNVVIEGYVENGNLVSVKRNSGVNDYIPVKTQDQLVEGTHVALRGGIRTRTEFDIEGNRHKKMYVWGEVVDPENSYINEVEFEGTICRKDVLRDTPKGKTVIDFIVAVNDTERNCSYYISCIAWSGSARWVNRLETGTRVHIKGRFQSRDYMKNEEIKTAYEISVMLIHKVKNERV